MAQFIKNFSIKVPASIANIGAGYDTQAIALDLYNEFEVFLAPYELTVGSEQFEVVVDGNYARGEIDLSRADNNLFVSTFKRNFYDWKMSSSDSHKLVPDVPIFVRQKVNIPPRRGLGSSATAAAAGVMAAMHAFGSLHPKGENARIGEISLAELRKDLNQCATLAMHADKCPDNVCAALVGGITTDMYIPHVQFSKFIEDGSLRFYKNELTDPNLFAVALIPEQSISTIKAREILRHKRVLVAQAALNVQRSSCLPFLLQNRDYEYLAEALKDELHQVTRAEGIFTGYEVGTGRAGHLQFEKFVALAMKAGAKGACIGGAGSTLIAFVVDPSGRREGPQVKKVIQALRANFAGDHGFGPTGWTIDDIVSLRPTNKGLHLSSGEPLRPGDLPPDIEKWHRSVSDGRPLRQAPRLRKSSRERRTNQ